MNKQWTGAGEWRLAAAGCSLGLLVLLLPLLTQRAEPKWDAMDQFLPAFTYLADSLREGRFPLWDPYTNCGYPFHAEPQFHAFNPLAMILSLISDSPFRAFVWFWVLHWLWACIGMLHLARQFGAAPVGACLASLSWALSGFFLGHAQHTSYIMVAAWLPWVFAFADRAVARSSIASALLAGAAMGLGSLGGYPGLVLFSCLALAIWLALRHLPSAGGPRPLSSRLAWILGTLALTGGLLLLIWSPVLNAFFIEGKGYTDRIGQLDPDTANLGHPFTFAAAVSLFYPFATFIARQWMEADISMTNGYMGILVPPLAAFWILKGRSATRPWWLLAFAAFMFWVSLGGEYGLRSLLYHLYPPLRYMRFSAPIRLFWMLPLVLASGLALSQLVRHPDGVPALLRILLAWFAAAAAAAVGFCLWVPVSGADLLAAAPRLFLPGLSILAAATLLVWFFSRESRPGRRYLPYLLLLLAFIDLAIHLYNNSGTVWNRAGLADRLAARHQPTTALAGPPPARLPGRPFGYLNAQQILKVPLVRGYVTMQSEGFDEILCSSRFVEVMSGPVRFWLSPGVEQAFSREHALQVLSRTGADSPVPVFLDGRAGDLSAARVVPGSFGKVEVRAYAPERVELAVHVPGSRPAFLASTERYAAGWRLYVDGVRQPVWKTNLYFRGAVVPAGSHRLVWQYEPARWRPLLVLSFLTLTGAPAAAWLLRRREGQRQNGSHGRTRNRDNPA